MSRTTIDITDEENPAGGPCLPSTFTIGGDNEVSICIDDTEFLMTFSQFLLLYDAMSRWAFRAHRGSIDVTEETDPDVELKKLRRIVGGMVNNGEVGNVELDDRTRDALRSELARPFKLEAV